MVSRFRIILPALMAAGLAIAILWVMMDGDDDDVVVGGRCGA